MPAPLKLQLTWPNKDKFLLVPKDDTGKPVWVEPDHPAAHEVRLADFTDAYGDVNDDNPHSDNLLFTGDSLDVLRILTESPEYQREYRGKVKLVYIDPPFNTGTTFQHYDDWMEHSTWLSFMRDRLTVAFDLLHPEGLIWVHLDNSEVHRMRCLMDEVFGAASYLNTVIWKRTGAKAAARKSMSTLHDTILVYGRSPAATLSRLLIPLSVEAIEREYRHMDERGAYQLITLTAPGVRSGDSGQAWQGVDPSEKNRHWSAPTIAGVTDGPASELSVRERLDRLLESGYIQLPSKEDGAPRFKYYLNPDSGVTMGDVWTDIKVLINRSGERIGYDTQKPEALLERVISMSTDPGDIVVDVFAGSGTTATAAHKMDRRWVTADILPATTDGYTRPRLQRVVDGTDRFGATSSSDWRGGGGFRSVLVAPSMYEVTPYGVLLAEWATNGRFSRAVASQLGFEWQADAAPFCGARGRMRLAVLDGALGAEEARLIASALGEKERVTVVAQAVLDGAETVLSEAAPGSRVRKAPRDLLNAGARRARRRIEGGLA